MGFEPDVREFLKKVLWSISVVLLYLLINFTAGLRFKLFFVENTIQLKHYIFYGWLLLSTVWLFWTLYKWWQKKYPHG